MSDNKLLKGKADRSKVAGGESYEVSYLAHQLGVSYQQITGAIRVVGNDREKIKSYLRRKNG